MKYITEFRDAAVAQALSKKIHQEVKPDKQYNIMEFCGSHTHAIFRHGIQDLLPESIHLIHGPGCPVCVLPINRLNMAIYLAQKPNVILCSYGDMIRVPGKDGISLQSVRAEGADVRIVYSVMDALETARTNPNRSIVFFAIGFETTAPPTALILQIAKKEKLKNFFVFCNHVLTPGAIAGILDNPEIRSLGSVPIDGFIGPAHVSVVIGTQPYEYFAEEYQKPVVIAGFEPLDILQAIRMLVAQMNEERSEVENEYSRAVTRDGNTKSKQLVADVFELRRRFQWRGLGSVPYSGLKIKSEFAAWDAEIQFKIPDQNIPDHKACECAAVLRGVKKPPECKVFGLSCTPETPLGSCMVSAEGACAAYYTYGRFRTHEAAS
ncbi:MAG: hydrogenase formation protein HypD [Candidatus Marinimicrobia bacterium]|nr:hydrogenase formation protein HypD [Candidatus Neomarinimicrobiota bacterium]